jgi:hypothetical protein
MTKYRSFKIGDIVTVRSKNILYDGQGVVSPGDIGIIKSFPPYVTGPNARFALVCFPPNRAGIDIPNLRKVPKCSLPK